MANMSDGFRDCTDDRVNGLLRPMMGLHDAILAAKELCIYDDTRLYQGI